MVIVDEFGVLEGIVMFIDIFEVIVGEFFDEGEELMLVQEVLDGLWLVSGWMDICRVVDLLCVDL